MSETGVLAPERVCRKDDATENACNTIAASQSASGIASPRPQGAPRRVLIFAESAADCPLSGEGGDSGESS